MPQSIAIKLHQLDYFMQIFGENNTSSLPHHLIRALSWGKRVVIYCIAQVICKFYFIILLINN